MPTKLLGSNCLKISSISHIVFNQFFPKVNQIIRHTQRTILSNLNDIHSPDNKIIRKSCPQAFQADIVRVYYRNFSVGGVSDGPAARFASHHTNGKCVRGSNTRLSKVNSETAFNPVFILVALRYI